MHAIYSPGTFVAGPRSPRSRRRPCSMRRARRCVWRSTRCTASSWPPSGKPRRSCEPGIGRCRSRWGASRPPCRSWPGRTSPPRLWRGRVEGPVDPELSPLEGSAEVYSGGRFSTEDQGEGSTESPFFHVGQAHRCPKVRPKGRSPPRIATLGGRSCPSFLSNHLEPSGSS